MYRPQSVPNDIVPCSMDISRQARQNEFFRTVVWTGNHLQLTIMSIPPCGEIGLEIHPETDQLIRIEAGQAIVRMGKSCDKLDTQYRIGVGEVVLIPCGVWHNVMNPQRSPLKLSSIYAPPHHPQGTVHRAKQDAKEAD